jgi:5-methyltetrahydropteroyltriglutamate--homocysteine methyltransferase
MRRSTDRILTTHVGALPGPLDVWAHPDVADERLREAVADVCAMQRSAGVDFINEGELTKGGHWVEYLPTRLGGYEPSETGGAYGALLMSSKDWVDFRDFYLAVLQNGTLFEMSGATQHVPEGAEETSSSVDDWIAAEPVHFKGHALLEREIAMMKESLGDTPASDVFLTTTAPLSIEPGREKGIYASDEEHIYAIAEAMREEYEAIANAGFQVQVDDAWMGALWDRIGIPMGIDGYRKFCEMRCEALNHALRNIPEEQIRYHLCWGSWHGPHSADLPLPDIVDIMLKIKAQMYLIEAANVRHEHEAEVWATTKLPDGKMLAPGVVTHSTPLIEHPQLVANRIERFAKLVGRENVIASTDCGLGLRLHPSLAWAKLGVLVEGARLATANLW